MTRKLEELIVAFARDELGPIESRWVAVRLSTTQKQRVAELRSSLVAAKNYSPRLSEEHRDRLVGRVNAMIPRSRPTSAWWAIPVGAALAVAVVVGFMLGSEQSQPSVDRVATLDFSDAEIPVVEVAVEQRNQITPHLRAIVSKDWVGRIDGDERESHVRVDRGQVAFGFEGGDGRRLEVTTEHARVVVVGTRFSVEVNPEGTQTAVAVSQGRVQVWRGRKSVEVSAGEWARISEDGLSVRRRRASALLDDPYLVEITGKATARRRAKPIDFGGSARAEPKPERSAQLLPEVSLEEELNQLERADAAVAARRISDAVAIYQTLIAQGSAPLVRQMARLGRARALGREGKLRVALQELRVLGEFDGEVGRQARLSECSVQRRFQPCLAQACFEALRDDPDREVAAEAKREAIRARQSGLRCEEQR